MTVNNTNDDGAKPAVKPEPKIGRPEWLNVADLKRRGWHRAWLDPVLGPPVPSGGGNWWRRDEVERAERDGRYASIRQRFEQEQRAVRDATREAARAAVIKGLADAAAAAKPLPRLTMKGVQPEEWVVAILHSPLPRSLKGSALGLAWAFAWHGLLTTRQVALWYWTAHGSGDAKSREAAVEDVRALQRRGWLSFEAITATDPKQGTIIHLHIPEVR